MNIFQEMTTLDMIQVVERIKPAASYLVDTMFPNAEVTMQDAIPIEYSKGHRRLAPYIVNGSLGRNVKRDSTQVRLYRCPLAGAKRVIGLDEISRRMIGEMPIVSTKTPEDRAQELMARDLVELQRTLINRKSQQASELLQTGKVTVYAYADDGMLASRDEIIFAEESEVVTAANWTATNADIFKDIKEASEAIQEESGIIPTLLICGKNIEGYMLKNKEFREWLLSGAKNASSVIDYEPRYESPQVRNLGFIPALNLEMVSYTETYMTEAGEVKPFIDADSAILCNPGRGKAIYGRVDVLEGKEWHSYSAEYVPVYRANDDAQVTSLTLFSRCLLVPEDISDFKAFKVSV